MTDGKVYENLTAEQQLNFYRNKYYTEGDHTEKGIIANAINDILPKYVRQKAEIERLRKENEILSKNAAEAFQEGLNENRKLFTEEILKEFAHFLIDRSEGG